MKRAVLVSIAALVAAPAMPSDVNGLYDARGYGARPCAEFLAARDAPRGGAGPTEADFVVWLTGYFTAYNRYNENTYSISGSADTERILRWLRTYCSANPGTAFVEAAEALSWTLYPQRLQVKPDGEASAAAPAVSTRSARSRSSGGRHG